MEWKIYNNKVLRKQFTALHTLFFFVVYSRKCYLYTFFFKDYFNDIQIHPQFNGQYIYIKFNGEIKIYRYTIYFRLYDRLYEKSESPKKRYDLFSVNLN